MRSGVGKNVLSEGKVDMQIEEITSSLKERGVVWQAVGFAVLGTASVAALSIYSDSQHWIVTTYRLAATELNWAYVAIIALAIEGARKLFEKATEIRRRYSEEADAKAMEKGRQQGEQAGIQQGRQEGREEGEREALDRVRSELSKHGIELPPDAEEAIYGKNGHSR